MQAIEISFKGPTNSRGARIKAECAAKTRFYERSDIENMLKVRRIALCEENLVKMALEVFLVELGWNEPGYGRWVLGGLKNGNWVFVSTTP